MAVLQTIAASLCWGDEGGEPEPHFKLIMNWNVLDKGEVTLEEEETGRGSLYGKRTP